MKIGILEVCSKNHYVLVESWIKVLHYLGHEPILFIDEDVNNLLNKNFNVEKIIKMKNQSMKSYLKQISSYKVDYLIITSLQSYLIDFLLYFRPSYKFALTIHNAKTWFLGNKLHKPKNIIKRFIRYYFKKKADKFFVSSDNMKKFILNHTDIKEYNIYVMPFMLNNNMFFHKNTKIKKIVYPGIISTTRKKYDNFFKLAQRYENIEFVLLGSPSNNPKEKSKEVINKIKKLNLNNVKYFQHYLSDEEYQQELKTASLIFSELRVEFFKEDYEEIYGETKDTGISYLMIKYSLPLIVNIEFKNLHVLDDSTLYFSSTDDLYQILEELLNNNTKYKKLLENAIKSSKLFTVDKVAENLKGFFDEIK
ncbi:hypothetical protein NAMH_1658 [Nautilia profundicola AmH]|uniref:Uncharacterized protein n=1 Tax=Nautilia profundicola (strain ATCC BAA-1463 / DSM 18972 / AmH) TaxID=598659 RepID=B9L6Q0_NAUPA|nr:hypothetical protein [Nautilia profundicola]ACM92277.1 hypothetical protein NAMH_1658 [Nautilia profundicola AmH]